VCAKERVRGREGAEERESRERQRASEQASEREIGSSDSVLSKTAIFPKKEGRKREIFNESARGSSFREANV